MIKISHSVGGTTLPKYACIEYMHATYIKHHTSGTCFDSKAILKIRKKHYLYGHVVTTAIADILNVLIDDILSESEYFFIPIN